MDADSMKLAVLISCVVAALFLVAGHSYDDWTRAPISSTPTIGPAARDLCMACAWLPPHKDLDLVMTVDAPDTRRDMEDDALIRPAWRTFTAVAALFVYLWLRNEHAAVVHIFY
jgi:hypothetical protein